MERKYTNLFKHLKTDKPLLGDFGTNAIAGNYPIFANCCRLPGGDGGTWWLPMVAVLENREESRRLEATGTFQAGDGWKLPVRSDQWRRRYFQVLGEANGTFRFAF